MNNKASSELDRWLRQRLTDDQSQWFSERLQKLEQGDSDRDHYITFGMIPRKLGRNDLSLDAAELRQAAAARQHWDPSQWSVDTAARALFLCRLDEQSPDKFADKYIDFCRSADLSESISLYNSLPILSNSEGLDRQVGEGLRTNIRAIFEAIAHRNPYPMEQFDQNRWNHMVLKALFVDSTLAPIQGIDDRANAELAGILRDYAHERWAANRPVTIELWRCIGPFAEGEMIEDLNRVVDSGSELERQAALLALSKSPGPDAQTILKNHPETATAIASGALSWESLATGDTRP